MHELCCPDNDDGALMEFKSIGYNGSLWYKCSCCNNEIEIIEISNSEK